MAKFKKMVVTGNKIVEVVVEAGSIWMTIQTGNGIPMGGNSMSPETATCLATMLLNAAYECHS